MRLTSELHSLIIAAGIPLTSIRMLNPNTTPPTVELVFNGATGPQQTQAASIRDAFDWSDAAGNRAQAVTAISAANGVALRGLIIGIGMALKAANPSMNLPTLAQVKTAVVNAINAGQAD